MLGTGSFGEICQAVEDVMHGGRPLYFGDKSGPVEEIGRVITTGPGWAYLRIAEGCDNWCAFCAIPAIRGRYRSRALDAIVQEAKELTALGVKELIVIAQDITRWGTDLYGKPSLALLLRELVKVEGIRWIRLHYLYPEIMDDELIDLIANEDKIVKYLDIPIQHINNDILRRMNRHCTGDEIRALLQKLKALHLTITSPRPIAEAIVTAGGVDVREVDPKTMRSKKVQNLLFAGEVLDVDAYTGGYNLQIAFSTGYLAGQNC